ncbi:hypothetical protein IWX46DRAFT_617522 [Phyllosticta citricarpa]|uniref:Secreted protein n=1 Tax=Phyllosticta citricarpa TaxID=55181 RepID=A0ABR1L275_9PEZI
MYFVPARRVTATVLACVYVWCRMHNECMTVVLEGSSRRPASDRELGEAHRSCAVPAAVLITMGLGPGLGLGW